MEFERSSSSNLAEKGNLTVFLKQLAKYQVPRDEDDTNYILSFEITSQDAIKVVD
jgi:hypothetical protein